MSRTIKSIITSSLLFSLIFLPTLVSARGAPDLRNNSSDSNMGTQGNFADHQDWNNHQGFDHNDDQQAGANWNNASHHEGWNGDQYGHNHDGWNGHNGNDWGQYGDHQDRYNYNGPGYNNGGYSNSYDYPASNYNAYPNNGNYYNNGYNNYPTPANDGNGMGAGVYFNVR